MGDFLTAAIIKLAVIDFEEMEYQSTPSHRLQTVIIASTAYLMPPPASHAHHLIVLYDGLCGLCDGVVQFLLRHDTKDVFRFAPQQSEFALQILARHGLDATASETICLIENYGLASERVLTKSEATVRIARGLGGIWRLARVTKVLPLYVRDTAYDYIARNRYRIFGRRTECRLVTTAEQYKFLG